MFSVPSFVAPTNGRVMLSKLLQSEKAPEFIDVTSYVYPNSIVDKIVAEVKVLFVVHVTAAVFVFGFKEYITFPLVYVVGSKIA